MNFYQVSRIQFTPDVVDGIVFWTKNPAPMLGRLDELKAYTYYFQFTITPYGRDIEANIPPKKTSILSTFKRLSDMIGIDRVVWRYDPIMLNETYPLEYHIHTFGEIARELHDYTRKVTISFVDEEYRGVKNNMKDLALSKFLPEMQIKLSSQLAEIAHSHGLTIDTCAEGIDLQQFGIGHARCIDDRLFEKLLDCPLDVDKDKNQRLECGCVTSIDIGMYHTCLNGCRYCYANYNQKAVKGNFEKHNPLSPLISGETGSRDRINDRVVTSCKRTQIQF